VRDIDLIGVLGSVGYWEGAIELIASGAVLTEPLVTQTFAIDQARDAIERLVDPGSLKVLVEPR
jgi:threonine dehydrogenase-like Zn-dependent dehydrogenase